MIYGTTGDPHFYAAALASEAIYDLMSFLPETDIVCEILELIETQIELFSHMIQGKHFGTDDLEVFIEFCQDMMKQAERLKEKLI